MLPAIRSQPQKHAGSEGIIASKMGNLGGNREGLGGWEAWACRSPDWLWGSAVERALVERE